MKTNIMLSTITLPSNEIVCEIPFIKNKFTNEFQYVSLVNQKFDNSLLTQLFNTIPLVLNHVTKAKKYGEEFNKKDVNSLIEDYLKELDITSVTISNKQKIPVQVHINEFPKVKSVVNRDEFNIYTHIQEVNINSHEVLTIISFKFDIMNGELCLLDIFNIIEMKNKLGIFSPKKIHFNTEYEKNTVKKLSNQSDIIMSILNDKKIILTAFEQHFNFKFKETSSV